MAPGDRISRILQHIVFSHFVLLAGSPEFMLENQSIGKPALTKRLFTTTYSANPQ
jgi:hypothetical protein